MDKRGAKEIWETALGELQVQITRPNYETWLKGTTGLAYEGNKFVLGAPSPFAAEWLHKRLRPLIEKTLARILKETLQVEIRVNQTTVGRPLLYGSASQDDPTSPAFYEPSEQAQLNPKYTFENFIVGSFNILAHAAATAVAAEPGLKYNPLFIYAGVGLGKTHLLHAIGHVAREKNLSVLYVSAEQFTNDLISSIRERKTEDFRNKYRLVDVLLIDDIQFMRGKEQTQESFFHTFNELQNHSKQIVLTSDRHPKSMVGLEERLISRFEGGLLADIQPPDLETRLAILKARVEKLNIFVPHEALNYIAQMVQTNIRELEGTLNRVLAYAKLTRSEIDIDLISKAIAPLPYNSKRKISPEKVVESVARYYDLSQADLEGKSRKKSISLARQIAIYLLRQESQLQFARIGMELGDRDHTTVIYSYQKVASELEKNPQIKKDLSQILDMLKNSPHSQ